VPFHRDIRRRFGLCSHAERNYSDSNNYENMLQLSRAKGPAVLVKVLTVVRCVVRACAIADVDQRGNRVRARDIKPIFRKLVSLRENGFAQ